MASNGGGKMRPKRNQPTGKPYQRNQSFLKRISSSVKDLSHLIIPSWLGGETSESSSKEDELKTPDSIPEPEPTKSNVLPAVATTASTFHTDTQDPFLHNDQQSASGATGFAVKKMSNTTSRLLSSESSTKLRMSESYLNEKPDTESHQIMVSTGSLNRSQSVTASKRQRLWTPDPASSRQGKPMMPPVVDKPSFNSILFGSLDKSDSSFMGESYRESSFYSGKTRYGGAAADKSFNKSLPYQSSLPLRKQVKANKPKSHYKAVTSSTAQRILETLDRMSTTSEASKSTSEASDSVLSFTPSSYRRMSMMNASKSATRPLQLPKGPPTRQYPSTNAAEIFKNRYKPPVSDEQGTSKISDHDSIKSNSASITQTQGKEKTQCTIETPSTHSAPMSSGKIKTKKFSQHITPGASQSEEEPPEVPNLRTDFTLPVSKMTPISLPNFSKPQASIPSSVSQPNPTPIKFTFSTPIQKSQGGPEAQNALKKDFTFSSPIQASNPKPNGAGAEGGTKGSPEPAVGASSGTVAMATPVWSTAARPKASSPDIGGTSSSFKSYSKWGEGKEDVSAASALTPSKTLKKGSVMDILGSGGGFTPKSIPKASVPLKKDSDEGKTVSEPAAVISAKTSSSASTSSWSSDMLAKFKKPTGSWECDVCMIQNDSSAQKCVACENPKPGASDEKSSESSGVSKPTLNGPTASAVKVNSGGGFSFDLPSSSSTSATTEGSAGFKFGSVAVSSTDSKSSSAQLSAGTGGFAFGQTSKAESSVTGGFAFGQTSKTAPTVTGGFVFGQNSSNEKTSSETSNSNKDDVQSSKSQNGFSFGAPSSVATPSSDINKSVSNKSDSSNNKTSFVFGSSASNASDDTKSNSKPAFGFSLDNDNNNKLATSIPPTTFGGFGNISPQTSSSFEAKPVSFAAPLTSSIAPAFNFGATTSSIATTAAPPTFSFTPATSTPAPTFVPPTAPSQTPSAPAGLFTFGGSTAAPSKPGTGLGMSKSLSDASAAPLVNGGFKEPKAPEAASKNTNVFGGGGSFGSAASPGVFAFGQPAAPTAQKRPVESNDNGLSAAKKAPAVNGLFAFGASSGPASAPVFGSTSTNATSGSAAGGFVGFAAPAGPAPGGFGGFGSSPSPAAPAFGQPPAAAAAPPPPAFGSTAQPAGVSFSSTPNFNFGASSSSHSSGPFQFGGNSNANATPAAPTPAAPSGLFAFGAHAAPAPAGPGSFSIGSSDSSQKRVIKRAVRKKR